MNYTIGFMDLCEYPTENEAYWINIMENNKRSRVENFLCAEDKKRVVLGDILTRKMLSKQLGLAPNEIDIFTNSCGKPQLYNNQNIHFSVSHSYNLIACAVSENFIGVDVEFICKTDLRQIDLFCTKEEKEYILSGEDVYNRFFEIWTFKEAYYKATGKIADHTVCCFNCNSNKSFWTRNGYAITVYCYK